MDIRSEVQSIVVQVKSGCLNIWQYTNGDWRDLGLQQQLGRQYLY
jgi:hypothetical protein